MAESEEELKVLLMKVKEESEKAGLKLSIQNKQTNKQTNTEHGTQSLHFMTGVNIYSDFGAQENEVSHCFQCLSIYLP